VAKVKGVRRAAITGEIERVATACRLEAVLDDEIFKLSKGYRSVSAWPRRSSGRRSTAP
jgi:energy-coupling factor transporter ATP-binding protein EcfA2